ncbi:helix-turn-helix domain-containing protein [Desulfotruncus alcoholivorax]|uniref:helix-turn-helix domain-containing protein n=1 Tax=Desulfotruncus alcoholivorax TaxID=265477 RepID=UPI000427845C|nr:helix-turn-helix transcriptional regulator [Desulfotruncus alcoholivorax]
MSNFAKRLKELRLEKEISQEDFGKIFNLSKSTISLYESGKREPDYITLQVFSEYFDCSTDYLLGNSDSRETAEQLIEKAISDDPKVVTLFNELKRRDDLQLLFKQVKELSPKAIKRIIKYIKIVEDEEAKED